MAKTDFFHSEEATDICYLNIRAARNEYSEAGRRDCQELWEIYEPNADSEFLIEVRKNFDARYWEMYLTVFLIRQGYQVICPKPGPDVGIEISGRKIWFEATSPNRGADGTADQVPDTRPSKVGEPVVVHDVPNEKMVLRYLNSISVKYYEQYQKWLKQNIVSVDDAFVIAINPRQLPSDYADTQPPRILQAAFNIGDPYVSIDTKSLKAVDSGYTFRDSIKKASGNAVATGVFQNQEYNGLSALLCSRVDCVNQPAQMGSDFQLVPNPNANVPLPETLRLKGTFFKIEKIKDGYQAIPEYSD